MGFFFFFAGDSSPRSRASAWRRSISAPPPQGVLNTDSPETGYGALEKARRLYLELLSLFGFLNLESIALNLVACNDISCICARIHLVLLLLLLLLLLLFVSRQWEGNPPVHIAVREKFLVGVELRRLQIIRRSVKMLARLEVGPDP